MTGTSPRTIRPATVADAPLLAAAERAIAAGHPGRLVSTPAELRDEAFVARVVAAAAGDGHYLVATVADALVAHAQLAPMSLTNKAHIARLTMCVHVGHWRAGHGQALLAELLTWARAQAPALHKLELLVRAENPGAIALYARAGFVVEGRLRDAVRLPDGTFVDDLTMALLL